MEMGREMYSPYNMAASRDSLQTAKRGVEFLGALKVLMLDVLVHFMMRRGSACFHIGARSSGGRFEKRVKTRGGEGGCEVGSGAESGDEEELVVAGSSIIFVQLVVLLMLKSSETSEWGTTPEFQGILEV